jgi:hypothetical protein
MRMCPFLVPTVSLVLAFPSGSARSAESDVPRSPAFGAPKEQKGQEVRILVQLLASGQRGENPRIVLPPPQDGRATGVLRLGPQIDYKIRVVRPDPNVEYKILVVRPDPKVDYKIRNLYPGGPGLSMVPRAHGGKTVIIRPPPDGRDD